MGVSRSAELNSFLIKPTRKYCVCSTLTHSLTYTKTFSLTWHTHNTQSHFFYNKYRYHSLITFITFIKSALSSFVLIKNILHKEMRTKNYFLLHVSFRLNVYVNENLLFGFDLLTTSILCR